MPTLEADPLYPGRFKYLNARDSELYGRILALTSDLAQECRRLLEEKADRLHDSLNDCQYRN